MTEPIGTMYGLKIVGIALESDLARDVTLVTVEVPNRMLDFLTPEQREELYLRSRVAHYEQLTHERLVRGAVHGAVHVQP